MLYLFFFFSQEPIVLDQPKLLDITRQAEGVQKEVVVNLTEFPPVPTEWLDNWLLRYVANARVARKNVEWVNQILGL